MKTSKVVDFIEAAIFVGFVVAFGVMVVAFVAVVMVPDVVVRAPDVVMAPDVVVVMAPNVVMAPDVVVVMVAAYVVVIMASEVVVVVVVAEFAVLDERGNEKQEDEIFIFSGKTYFAKLKKLDAELKKPRRLDHKYFNIGLSIMVNLPIEHKIRCCLHSSRFSHR